jgi:hypothetical protein
LLLVTAAALASCTDSGPLAKDSGADEVDAVEALGIAKVGATAGAWQAAGAGDTETAEFRAPNGEPLFTIGCAVRGGLLFSRHGFVARGDLGLMQLRTGGTVRRLASTTGGDVEPQVQARAPYNDQLIPALIRFAQPLEVRVEKLETLILPPSPTAGELVQRCQRDSRGAVTAPTAPR